MATLTARFMGLALPREPSERGGEGFGKHRFGDLVHHGIAVGRRVDVILRQALARAKPVAFEGAPVVGIRRACGLGIGLYPCVEALNARAGIKSGAPGKLVRGRDRGQDHADAVCLCHFGHAAQVALDLLVGHRAGVGGDIVGARHDLHGLGPQIDHVLPEADEHLRGGLATNPAPDPARREERAIEIEPALCDGIADQHDPGPGAGRDDGGIVGAIPGSPGPVDLKADLCRLIRIQRDGRPVGAETGRGCGLGLYRRCEGGRRADQRGGENRQGAHHGLSPTAIVWGATLKPRKCTVGASPASAAGAVIVTSRLSPGSSEM